MGLAPASNVLQQKRDMGAPALSIRKRVGAWMASMWSCANETAVCVPPGARLSLKKIPKHLQRKWKVNEEEDVVFTQISAEVYAYRDAVRFQNGSEALLQDLDEGMLVNVVSLASSEDELATAETTLKKRLTTIV